MTELVNIQGQLTEIVSRMGVPITGGGSLDDYLCCVAKGLIQFVCLHTGRGIYRSLTAEKIGIHPGSVMFKETPPFLVAGEIVKTSRMYARSVSPIKKEWLARISPTLFTSLMEAERGPRRSDDRFEGDRDRDRPREAEGDRSGRAGATTWEVRIGREAFPLRSVKGKEKVVLLNWDQLEKVLASSKATSFPELKNLKGELTVDGFSLLAGSKANRIIEVCRKLDPRKDRITNWPQGITWSTKTKLKGLVDLLDSLMKLTPVKSGSTTLGFLGLQTDNRGQYWLKVDKTFPEALAFTLASLEALADDSEEFLDKADFKEVNAAWRRINQLL
jgi:hypothetical protein